MERVVAKVEGFKLLTLLQSSPSSIFAGVLDMLVTSKIEEICSFSVVPAANFTFEIVP